MNKLSEQKVLIIGGAGFIGHNLALKLKDLGASVEIIDSLQVNNLLSFASGHADNPNSQLYYRLTNQRLDLLKTAGVPVHIQDARDYHALNVAINQINPTVIVHLAAIAHANRSNKDPFSTFDHSLRTLENALDSARAKNIHFVYFSSSMVYGNFATGEVSEDSICEPLGIYGALKFAGEKMVIAYNQVFDLPYTIVRPSALYGERCVSRRVGQVFIESVLSGKGIQVNGDGTSKLDFTYIGDLTNGVVKIIENENSRKQIFNITYGRGREMNEMVEILKQHFPKIEITYVPKEELMPERGTLSVEKAKRLIGYQPEFPLEVGYSRYIEWYKSIW